MKFKRRGRTAANNTCQVAFSLWKWVPVLGAAFIWEPQKFNCARHCTMQQGSASCLGNQIRSSLALTTALNHPLHLLLTIS